MRRCDDDIKIQADDSTIITIIPFQRCLDVSALMPDDKKESNNEQKSVQQMETCQVR